MQNRAKGHEKLLKAAMGGEAGAMSHLGAALYNSGEKVQAASWLHKGIQLNHEPSIKLMAEFGLHHIEDAPEGEIMAAAKAKLEEDKEARKQAKLKAEQEEEEKAERLAAGEPEPEPQPEPEPEPEPEPADDYYAAAEQPAADDEEDGDEDGDEAAPYPFHEIQVRKRSF
jgi:hypothetical protein